MTYGLCHWGHMVAKYPLFHSPTLGDHHLAAISPPPTPCHLVFLFTVTQSH